MAFEMYGMLAGNVSALTGEYVKPAYGGEKEAFLKKVVTPIYSTIAKVHFGFALNHHLTVSLVFHASSLPRILSISPSFSGS
jgi:hypothetical protein